MIYLTWLRIALRFKFSKKITAGFFHRIQELRNKRWVAISRAKDNANRVKQDAGATEEQKKEAVLQAKKIFNDYSQKSWSLLGWFNPDNWASSEGSGCGEADTVLPTSTLVSSLSLNLGNM